MTERRKLKRLRKQKEATRLINYTTNNWSEIGPKNEKQFRLQ